MKLLNFLSWKFFNKTLPLENLNPDDVNEPIRNFDALWKEFYRSHANIISDKERTFWHDLYAKYRSKITVSLTNRELFEACTSMIHELNDGHSILYAKFNGKATSSKSPYKINFEHSFFSYEREIFPETIRFLDRVNQTLKLHDFDEPIIDLAEDCYTVYAKSSHFAYISTAMYTPQLKIFDQFISEINHLDGLIIDLRYNKGGLHHIALEMAGRFYTREETGYFVQRRKRGHNQLSEAKKRIIKPNLKPPFSKPVILLTSDATASSLEIFLLAMKQLPNVLIVGDKSEGILSSVTYFSLPNSWYGTITVGKVFSLTMIDYEGIGIEPDYMVKNDHLDITDTTLEKAFTLLNNH